MDIVYFNIFLLNGIQLLQMDKRAQKGQYTRQAN